MKNIYLYINNRIELPILIKTEDKEKSKKKVMKKPHLFYKVPGINGDVIITGADVFKIANIIDRVVFEQLPSLKALFNYFTEITKIISKVGLPLG